MTTDPIDWDDVAAWGQPGSRTAEVEIWRAIPGHELYEVSNQGRVRSFKSGTPRLLTSNIGHGGYPRVKMDGRPFTIHGLVALAWHGPRPEGLQVRHIDGDPSNATPANLRYGTAKENAEDRDRHGRTSHIGQPRKTHCKRGHAYEAPKGGCRICRRQKDRERHQRARAELHGDATRADVEARRFA